MQQTMFVMFFFVMIFILMSGLFTPIESMPTWAQWITYILPPRYFVEVMRSVYLKGTMFIELWPNYVALAVFAVLFNSMAALTYKKQVWYKILSNLAWNFFTELKNNFFLFFMM